MQCNCLSSNLIFFDVHQKLKSVIFAVLTTHVKVFQRDGTQTFIAKKAQTHFILSRGQKFHLSTSNYE